MILMLPCGMCADLVPWLIAILVTLVLASVTASVFLIRDDCLAAGALLECGRRLGGRHATDREQGEGLLQ